MNARNAGGVVGLIVTVWLVYLVIELARFLNAWPF